MEDPSFAEMARDAGLERKAFYSISEVARALGMTPGTIRTEINAGRLKRFLPGNRQRGIAIRPGWVDAWLEEGSGKAVRI